MTMEITDLYQNKRGVWVTKDQLEKEKSFKNLKPFMEKALIILASIFFFVSFLPYVFLLIKTALMFMTFVFGALTFLSFLSGSRLTFLMAPLFAVFLLLSAVSNDAYRLYESGVQQISRVFNTK